MTNSPVAKSTSGAQGICCVDSIVVVCFVFIAIYRIVRKSNRIVVRSSMFSSVVLCCMCDILSLIGP